MPQVLESEILLVYTRIVDIDIQWCYLQYCIQISLVFYRVYISYR